MRLRQRAHLFGCADSISNCNFIGSGQRQGNEDREKYLYFLTYLYKIYSINSFPSLANEWALFRREQGGGNCLGKKDAVSKHYMSKNEIFADAVNFYFFDGREKVKPEDLENGDAEELELLYGKHAAVHAVVEQEKNREKGKRKHKRRDSDLISVQRYRDILKRCVIREYGRTVYVIYGIEAQSEIHYAMPVKSMLYDALNYAAQVSEIADGHAKDGNRGKSAGEFLSGFHRTDRLRPVRTLVIYFGSAVWNGPRTLKEMLCLPEGEDFSSLND